jgi:dolichol kinase
MVARKIRKYFLIFGNSLLAGGSIAPFVMSLSMSTPFLTSFFAACFVVSIISIWDCVAYLFTPRNRIWR